MAGGVTIRSLNEEVVIELRVRGRLVGGGGGLKRESEGMNEPRVSLPVLTNSSSLASYLVP